MSESSEHFHKKITSSQLVNLSLGAFLLLGIAVTSYTVNNLRDSDAEAARGGKNVVASITLNQTDPKYGDTVTFTTTGGRNIAVSCFQGGLGDGVYSVAQPVGSSFLLTSPTWSPAIAADCWVWLYNRDLSKGALAVTRFAVNP